MPLLKNAKKALRASKRKTEFNARTKSRMKTMVKLVQTEPTKDSLAAAYSAVDIAAKKNIIHPNKAARVKSQLSRLAKSA